MEKELDFKKNITKNKGKYEQFPSYEYVGKYANLNWVFTLLCNSEQTEILLAII